LGCNLIKQGIVPVLAYAHGCDADAACSCQSGLGYAILLITVGLTIGEED
jgi:hypothetical protein